MRRSRKPVWAVSSIEGSNPSLSARQGVFRLLCRANALLEAVADGVARGSTQASVGPTKRDFVPSTFPPDAGAFVYIEQPTGGFQRAFQAHSGEQQLRFVGEESTLARTSDGRNIISARHEGRSSQGVVE
jgi:hypothetical protein